MSRRAAPAALAVLMVLAACAPEPREAVPAPPSSAAPLPEADILPVPVAPPLGGNLTPADSAPLVYMGLSQRPGGVIAVIFVMDRDRDGDPYNDPGAELRPADGECNLTDVEDHDLAPEYAERPVFGPDDARQGVTPDVLPAFMAVAVSSAMIEAGLAEGPGETHAQNVCTRKYWERLVGQTGAAG